MKELINVAEELYKQIDKAQVHLVNARLNNNEEGKKSAISEMETAMCNAMQLLKCFIERKDNIVDLSEVFHDVTEKPNRVTGILIDTGLCGCYVPFATSFSQEHWNYLINNAMKRWAYVDDLLPKGGE